VPAVDVQTEQRNTLALFLSLPGPQAWWWRGGRAPPGGGAGESRREGQGVERHGWVLPVGGQWSVRGEERGGRVGE